jgi:hypothetical protein
MSKLQIPRPTHPHPREGEGVSISVSTRNFGSYVQAGIDLAQLPAPARRFSADAAELRQETTGARLLFGQTEPILGGLLSLLVVNMDREAVAGFKDSIDENFRSSIKHNEFIPGALTQFKTKADQTAVLTCSMAYVGYTGDDGCIDFYYSSPFAKQQMGTSKKLSVDPVVRVNLPSGVMISIINEICKFDLNQMRG